MRCEDPCGKVVYTAENTVKLACVKAALSGHGSLSWYYSRDCGCWHITNTRRHKATGTRVRAIERFDHGREHTDTCRAVAGADA